MEELVIIGGGVSGLSCLNALLDRGKSPLLLEGSYIGSPKMCGEFLSPAAASHLKKWNIEPLEIKNAHFSARKSALTILFQSPAGALARHSAELQLAERGKQKGARIYENASIKKIIPPENPNSFYSLYLSSGECIKTKTAIFATGRFNLSNSLIPSSYYGIKFHLNRIIEPATLFMFSLPGAYLGFIPINETTSNCACLIDAGLIEKAGSPKNFFTELLASHKELNEIIHVTSLDDSNWLEGKAPTFQQKQLPNWYNSFWIGDALASLHPAIGSGFAHSIQSAILAADSIISKSPETYYSLCHTFLKKRLIIGKIMHHFLLNPTITACGMPLIKKMPWLINAILKKLDM